MRWGELDEAERLAGRAAAMRLAYGPFEQKPQDLLQRIADARRLGPGRAGAFGGRGDDHGGTAYAVALVREAAGDAAGTAIGRKCRGRRPSSWSARPARPLPPGNWIKRKCWPVKPNRCGCRTSPSRPARIGHGAAGSAVATAAGNSRQQRRLGASASDPTGDSVPYNPTDAAGAAGSDHRPRRMRSLRLRAESTPPPPNGRRSPPAACGRAPEPPSAQSPGMALFLQGEAALKAHDAARAYELFRQAANYPNDLDPVTAQRCRTSATAFGAAAARNPPHGRHAPSMADEAAARQQVLVRQVAAELANRESKARAMRETDPKGALAMLEEPGRKSSRPAWTSRPAINCCAASIAPSRKPNRSSSRTARKSNWPRRTIASGRTSSGSSG